MPIYDQGVPTASARVPLPIAGRRPRILVLFDPGRWKYRGALQGINRYATAKGGWELVLLRYHAYALPADSFRQVAGGALADASPESQRLARRLRCPVVNLSPHSRAMRRPSVLHDYPEAGRLALRTFREKGFCHVGVFTTTESFRLDAREATRGFIDEARRYTLQASIFTAGPRIRRGGRWVLDDQIADLADWLRDQPLPFGLLAIDDEHAWRALEASRLAGLSVPGDLAILGLGNDDCLCVSSSPALSSIAMNYEQAGFEAAALLDRLMAGRDPGVIGRISPDGVIERASSDILAIDDPLVAEAVRFISANLSRRPDIDMIARYLHTSRRTLHRRFMITLDRPPGEVIRRARLEAARRLITSTDDKLVTIATAVGFPSVAQLSRDIAREFGLRPTELRARRRPSR